MNEEEVKGFTGQRSDGRVLSILQFATGETARDEIAKAAREISTFHAPTADQAERHGQLSLALAFFLTNIVTACPPGPERSSAISRAREAKMWASAAVALEGK